jgi:GNAT superfamily N-acetyltransferase
MEEGPPPAANRPGLTRTTIRITVLSDLFVKLYAPENDELADWSAGEVQIKQAHPAEKHMVLDFIRQNFDSPGWVDECERAFAHDPVSCFIGVKDGEILGFSCWDVTAKGFFGPMGVTARRRKYGVGSALLKRALFAMKEYGYAYAVIGWSADDAIPFYQKCVHAELIPDSPPEKSIYRNLTVFGGK